MTKHPNHAMGSAVAVALLLGASAASAQPYGYVPNSAGGSVTVINVGTNTPVGSIPVGASPSAVALSADGSRAYIANRGSNSVSVIDTASNTVVDTIAVGSSPAGIVVSPDSTRVYVANYGGNSVTAINAANHSVIGTTSVGSRPQGIVVNPQGTKVYVASLFSDTVSVLDAGSLRRRLVQRCRHRLLEAQQRLVPQVGGLLQVVALHLAQGRHRQIQAGQRTQGLTCVVCKRLCGSSGLLCVALAFVFRSV